MVTVDDSRAAVHRAMQDLWFAVAELVINANDDQPEESDLAAAEQAAQLSVEVQARLAEALGGITDNPPASPRGRAAGIVSRRSVAPRSRPHLLAGSPGVRPGLAATWLNPSARRCLAVVVVRCRTESRTLRRPVHHRRSGRRERLARAGDGTTHRNETNEYRQEVAVTHDKKQPGLPVVEVDQAFPLMTTDGVSRATGSSGLTGDQGPAVSAAIRDVLGWRPRVQDPKAFTAALSASFALSTFEDHVVAKYVPRGVAVQADLGGVTGGQASLYLRAKAAHDQITRMLESLQPLRTDADSQDCEAYRGLVRDSVRRIVMELGREGGPRVALVDSAFGVLTGYRPVAQPAAAAAIPGGPAINPLGKQRIGAAEQLHPPGRVC